MKYLVACDHLTQVVEQDSPDQARQLSKCARCGKAKVRAYAYQYGDERFVSVPPVKESAKR